MEILICLALFGVVFAHETVNITEGSDVQPNQYYCRVSIQYQDNHSFCGGSLVRTGDDKIVVLTAASCFKLEEFDNLTVTEVVVGKHYPMSTEQNLTIYEHTYRAKKTIFHPEYNRSSNHNDLAIIYLAEDVVANPGVQPIELTSKPSVNYINEDCIISNWRPFTFIGGMAMKGLKDTGVELYPDVKCYMDFPHGDFHKFNMICGEKRGVEDSLDIFITCWGEGGVDTYKGDVGGPLACKDGNNLVLNGVTSWGIDCARPDKADIYTDIYMMRRWLNARLGL